MQNCRKANEFRRGQLETKQPASRENSPGKNAPEGELDLIGSLHSEIN
jgi:hypothetical protein